MSLLERFSGKGTNSEINSQKMEPIMTYRDSDILANLRVCIISKEEKKELLSKVNEIPLMWSEVTGETDTIIVSDGGVFEPDYKDRSAVKIVSEVNNKIYFTFSFHIGESDKKFAFFEVPCCAEIIKGDINFIVNSNRIPTKMERWKNMLIEEIIKGADK